MQSVESSGAHSSSNICIASEKQDSPLLNLLNEILEPPDAHLPNGDADQTSLLERQPYSLEVLVSLSEKPIFECFSTQRTKSISGDRSVTKLFYSRVPMAFANFSLVSGLHSEDFSTENR